MDNRAGEPTSLICKGLIVAIIIYPLLFLWQGLDFTDSGFHMTNYSLIFSNPESIQYSFMYWLTNVIGGTWLLLFGKLGVVGIRLFGVLMLWTSIYLFYKLMKQYIPRVYLLAGLLVVLVFSYNLTRIMDYNRLTALLYSIAILFLFKGGKESKNVFIALSGLVLGASVLARVSNVVGFTFVAGVVFYGLIMGRSLKKQVYGVLSFVSGYAGGIVLALALMKLLGHFEYFMNTMRLTSEISKHSSASHNFKYLLKLLIKDHVQALQYSGVAIAITILVLLIGKMAESLKFDVYRLKIPVYIMLVPFLIYFFYNHDPYMFFYNIYAVKLAVGLMYFASLAYITNLVKSSQEFRFIAFLGFILLFVTPLGSDNGMYNAIFGMWISGTLLFSGLCKLVTAKKISFEIQAEEKRTVIPFFMKNIRAFAQLLLVVFTVFTLVQGYRETFRDSYNRVEMRYPVQNQLLTGVLTTRERAAVVDEFLEAVNRYVSKDDYLLAHNNIPMVHYLTGAKPYLNNAWPELYIYEQYKAALDEAKSKNPELPVVIISKVNTSTTDWPKDHSEEYEKGYLAGSPTYKELQQFIKDRKYATVWKNQYFEILKAQ